MTASAAASGCSAAAYRLAPFMRQPAPADNIYELLSPVWWVMEGKPISSYPISTFWPQLVGYARHNGRVPVDGITALCALVLLSLLFFVLWRFVRCIRVVCCQQEAYADANKVLFSKRLRFMKGVTVALGLLACGAAAWGMASLDKNILPALNARIDSMQEFPSKVVQQVASLANETAALSQPLSNISTIISSIDAVGIREDLQHVTAFLKEAPSPTALKATLQQLSSALKPQLYEGLRQLHAQVNVASDSSPLAALKGYLDTLADFDISTMGPAISRYNDALAALFDIIVSDRSNAEVQASRQFARLKSSYDQVDLDAWVPYIDQAVTTANAINAMRTPATNPFTITLKSLNGVLGTIDNIRGNLLDSLSASVQDFNGLWHNNASVAFESLLDRAAHLNHTVLELPRDVESKVMLVNASVSDFMKLYKGQDSLLTLPDRIRDAGGKLAMPDASHLIAELKAAEAQLNDAQGLSELIMKLATLSRALDKTLRDAKSNIQPSLDAFAADDSMRVDLQDTLTFEGPVVQGVAGIFESANLGGFKEYIKAVLGRLDAAIEPARREADAIPGVLKQITEFDVVNSFMGPLQQAEQVYKQFDGKPEVLAKPVLDMLDRVNSISSTDLVNAQALVANVSSSVQKMSDSIQSAAVDGIDKFQKNYLGKAAANNTAAGGGTDHLVKAVHAVYNAMMASYAAIMGLVLVLLLLTLLNCPAGVCITGFILNTALVAFSLIPLLITVGLLLMRDTCGNMEAIAAKAVAQKAGNNSLPAAVSEYYLYGGPALANGTSSLPDIIKGINAEYDVNGFKSRVQQTVDDMLKGVTDDFNLRPQVSGIVDDATSRIESLLGRMDSVLLTLDHSSVSGVYRQGKSFFCCSLVNKVYTQWAATITVVALVWVVMQFAFMVLSRLDTLSENCCRFRPYRRKDYGSGSKPISQSAIAGMLPPGKRAELLGKPLQTVSSSSSETVAVISLGGTTLMQTGMSSAKTSSSGKTGFYSPASTTAGAELLDCTPLPAPLTLRTTPPHTAGMLSPRRAAAPAHLDTPADSQRRQQQQQPPVTSNAQSQQQQAPQQQSQQHRRPRVGDARPAINITAVYPSVMPSMTNLPGSPTVLQREQQQQQWANTPGGMPGKGLVRAPCTRI